MSVEILKHWLCNLCGATATNKMTEHKDDSSGEKGIPKGWTWFRSAMTGKIHHRCKECEATCAPQFKGIPLGRLH